MIKTQATTQQQAISIVYELEKFCTERDLWYEITRENRPMLNKIVMTISIKVDNKESA